MSILKEMGIQQWRLRKPLSNELEPQHVEQVVADQSVEFQPLVGESSMVSEVVESVEELAAINTDEAIEEHKHNPIASLDWQGLQALIDGQQQCPSCGAGKSLLGDGNPSADWLFITDAPSNTDTNSLQIFTGRAGQLFEAILSAIGLERKSVYTTSVFKCAPSDDLSMIPNCDKILHRQIELVQPKVVVALGEFAGQAVIKANDNLDVLRANKQTCFRTKAPIVATYSPAQMLDEATLKASVWKDLQRCMALVDGSR